MASLLAALRQTEATGQVTILLDRDPAAHASLDNLHGETGYGVIALLQALREVGAHGQAAAPIERLPAAGGFTIFCRQEGREEQFRFGREANGRPAKPWAWTDLG